MGPCRAPMIARQGQNRGRLRACVPVVLCLLGSACVSPHVPTIESYVTSDGRVVAEPARVGSGEVIIRVENDQNEKQRMVLVRTNRAATSLPVVGGIVPVGKKSDTKFKGDGYELIVKLDPMKPYFSGPLVLARINAYLKPGTYVLFSN